ncbi:uncharacterized protein LOC135170275 [Diachasmimorpha longicaudata]|uniref:uncharacterized protein LOC135170275 n=1 Tax=Diachasmimorpha longicaudata TaxID=58733 RepID=UPI0030B872E7
MLKKQILVLFILLGAYQTSGWLFDVLKLGRKIWKFVGKIQDMRDKAETIKNAFTGELISALFDEDDGGIEALSEQLENLRTELIGHLQQIESLVKHIPAEIKKDAEKAKYEDIIHEIDETHKSLLEAIQANNTAKWGKNPCSAMYDFRMQLQDLGPLLMGSDYKSGLLQMIARSDPEFETLPISIQEQLIFIFETVILTEIKGLHIIASCLEKDGASSKDWAVDMARAVKVFEERYKSYLNVMLVILEGTSPFIRSRGIPTIGPQASGESRSYYEIGSFTRPHVNMQDLTPSTSMTGGYYPQCAGINQKFGQCLIEGAEINNYCINDGSPLNLCMTGEEVISLKYSSKVIGSPDPCSPKNQVSFKHPATRMSWCYCLCHRETSKHYLSLTMSHANVIKNMVIIGARFVQHNKIIHVQVLEGKLLPDGKIERGSEQWVPLPARPTVIPLTWGRRNFVRHNPVLPFGYVLIGVQFIDQKNKFAISAVGKKYDIRRGVLLPGFIQVAAEYYLQNDHAESMSTLPDLMNTLDSKDGTYSIQLRKGPRKDASPNPTIPFFDGTIVQASPTRALAGIGLISKKGADSSEFISLQARLIPFKRHLAQLILDYIPGQVLEECNWGLCTLSYILDLGQRISTVIWELSELAFGNHVNLHLKIQTVLSEIAQDIDGMAVNMDIDKLRAVVLNSTPKPFKNEFRKWLKGARPILDKIDQSYDWLLHTHNTQQPMNYTYAQLLSNEIHGYIDEFNKYLLSSLSSRGKLIKKIDNQKPAKARKAQKAAVTGDQCPSVQSMHFIFTELFQTLMGYEIKSMVVLTFIAKLENPIQMDWKADLLKLRKSFQNRLSQYVELFDDLLEKFPTDINSCDPTAAPPGKVHIKVKEIGSEANDVATTYVSLDFNAANVTENMVITGIKFVLQDNILHIQIKKGRLMGHGQIDESSNHWVDPPKNPRKIPILANKKTFALNDHIFPSDYAVIGVGFIETPEIGIAVEARKFSFWNGTLLSRSIKTGGTPTVDNTLHEAIPHKGYHKRIPHGKVHKHEESTKSFSVTLKSVEDKKTGEQEVQPKFNGFSVESIPPKPMGGISIFRQERKNGEFISLKLHSLNFKENLEHFLEQRDRKEAFLEGF